MSDIQFIVHILASTIAICASYALIMSILKKEVSRVTVRGEAALALLSSGVSFALSYKYLIEVTDTIYMLSILFLSVGLLLSLIVVIRHRFKLPADGSYPITFASITRILSIMMFSSFTVHLLLEFAALTRL